MAQKHILVVEDDADIRELLVHNLGREGFRVSAAADGEEGLRAARRQPPDLLLLDLMLPGMDGLELCRMLKRDEKTASVPVVMLTAKGEESDVVAGLELGAADYVTKPFSPRVLLARVRAILRRGEEPPSGEDAPLSIGELSIHPGRREVALKGKNLEMTFTEFGILRHLAARPGWVFTRGQIVDAVRGAEYPVTERSVDVHVASLRKKLGAWGKKIETVRGVGYRLKD